MIIYWILLNALLGLIIGSFLNVLILRTNTGKSLAGRSGCLSCEAPLGVWNLIPIVSWLLQKAHCHHCGSAISVQYPLVEGVTAFVFVLVAVAILPLPIYVLTLILFSLYIAIIAYDMRHTIIPDMWSYGAALIACVIAILSMPEGGSVFWTMCAGPIVAAPLWLLWAVSKGRALGLGDAKLALSFGYLLGAIPGIIGLVYGFIIGGVVALVVLLPWQSYMRLYTRIVHPRLRRSNGTFTMKSEVPFGPFLVLGALIVWICLTFHITLPLFPYIV